jgi:hypothetical protein
MFSARCVNECVYNVCGKTAECIRFRDLSLFKKVDTRIFSLSLCAFFYYKMGTKFYLDWAEVFPTKHREAVLRHGYAGQFVLVEWPKEFLEDIAKERKEKCEGKDVVFLMDRAVELSHKWRLLPCYLSLMITEFPTVDKESAAETSKRIIDCYSKMGLMFGPSVVDCFIGLQWGLPVTAALKPAEVARLTVPDPTRLEELTKEIQPDGVEKLLAACKRRVFCRFGTSQLHCVENAKRLKLAVRHQEAKTGDEITRRITIKQGSDQICVEKVRVDKSTQKRMAAHVEKQLRIAGKDVLKQGLGPASKGATKFAEELIGKKEKKSDDSKQQQQQRAILGPAVRESAGNQDAKDHTTATAAAAETGKPADTGSTKQ